MTNVGRPQTRKRTDFQISAPKRFLRDHSRHQWWAVAKNHTKSPKRKSKSTKSYCDLVQLSVRNCKSWNPKCVNHKDVRPIFRLGIQGFGEPSKMTHFHKKTLALTPSCTSSNQKNLKHTRTYPYFFICCTLGWQAGVASQGQLFQSNLVPQKC